MVRVTPLLSSSSLLAIISSARALGTSNAAPCVPLFSSSSSWMRPTLDPLSRLSRSLVTIAGMWPMRVMRPLSLIICRVVKPSWSVNSDLGSGIAVIPDSAANATSRASWGSRDARTIFATGEKYDRTSCSTLSRRYMTCLAAASTTCCGVGGVIVVTPLVLVSRRILLNVPISFLEYMAIVVPERPARPVLPERCRKDSDSLGSS
mmetsp:Transcript_14304/g.40817  ORF Transcript_14304/g.40817 Transcript_14304/m.40817 type:complete len:206 (-) Transcript_14304:1469-2086(-)